jgi:hypothetical protein
VARILWILVDLQITSPMARRFSSSISWPNAKRTCRSRVSGFDERNSRREEPRTPYLYWKLPAHAGQRAPKLGGANCLGRIFDPSIDPSSHHRQTRSERLVANKTHLKPRRGCNAQPWHDDCIFDGSGSAAWEIFPLGVGNHGLIQGSRFWGLSLKI